MPSERASAGVAVALGLVALSACTETLPPCSFEVRSGCPHPVQESFADPLVHLGRAEGDTFIEPLDIAVDGDIVYVCTGTQGLTIWDAADGRTPRLLVENVGPQGVVHARFPRCQHVALDPANDRLVLTNRGDEVQPTPFLAVYDISDPSGPAEVDHLTTVDAVEGAIIRDGTVVAAMHTAGVQVFDLDTRLARRGGHADEVSDAWQPVWLDANTLAVAEAQSGLRIYDSTAVDPVVLADVPLAGSSRDVVVRDGRAYVATSDGLAVVDVADPSAPVVLSEIPTDGTTLAVALGLSGTVLTAQWDRLRGYDVTDPGAVESIWSELVPTDGDFSRVLGLGSDPERARVYAGEWEGVHAYEQRAEAIGPDLVPAPAGLQFGRVEPGDTADEVLVLRNRGNRPLTVFDVVGLSDLVPDTRCLQIGPGDSAALEVRYRPASGAELDAPRALKICSDDLDRPETFVGATANVTGVGVGDPVPDFDLRDLAGSQYSASSLEGNVAVLAYFATF